MMINFNLYPQTHQNDRNKPLVLVQLTSSRKLRSFYQFFSRKVTQDVRGTLRTRVDAYHDATVMIVRALRKIRKQRRLCDRLRHMFIFSSDDKADRRLFLCRTS